MVTKGVIRKVSTSGNRCIVRLPLFETASSTIPVEIEALVSITPGMFNNLFVGDVVFVSFEENALEKPIIIGKLYKGTQYEESTPGGAGIVNSLTVREKAHMPAETTNFVYKGDNKSEYDNFTTPKKIADYIKWLEKLAKQLIDQLYDHFRCFKCWTQWQLQPENVEIDDGDLDTGEHITTAFKNQAENQKCDICGSQCTKENKTRRYIKTDTSRQYPD